MKTNRCVYLICLALALIWQGLDAQTRMPDISLEDNAGLSVKCRSLFEEGEAVIVTLWGTFCRPCIKELDAISEYLEDNEASGFKVVAICVDDSRSVAKARAFAAGHGWDGITMLYDPTAVFRQAFNINSVPHSFVFDKEGKVRYSHSGYVPGSEIELFSIINDLPK